MMGALSIRIVLKHALYETPNTLWLLLLLVLISAIGAVFGLLTLNSIELSDEELIIHHRFALRRTVRFR